MIIFYLVLFLLIIIPMPRFKKCGGDVFEDYIAPDETLYIKGIFVVLVMLSHFKGYITMTDSFADVSFSAINGHIGQLMVTLFFFYSGYGIFESIKSKGKRYVIGFPKKRFLFTWISFAVCVLLFLVEGILMGKHYELKTILLSFIGWESLGNSNWFMFVTFGLYALFIIAFSFGCDITSSRKLILFTVFTIFFTAFLYIFKESWWWDTMLCFPAGMWFSKYKKQIDNYMKRGKYTWIVSFVLIVVLFLMTYYLQRFSHFIYLISSVCFCLIVIWLTMKVKIRNPILSFLGKHVFSIYILQRFWYILFSSFELNRYLFMGMSVLTILLSAFMFDMVFDKVKVRFFKK